eukprot:CAMPEP_0205906640 /NCGR_PEP_ID=MMETSP1325-20131115/2056_1 /ASSEMBLY_ACC=CAM_ASM_000708 /TAXON_ID=236786 /ORGANISM="Florenciella sp., Strain RCC1007" /LENGTH=78 /DNA_ID=CAMNT_0053272665 /DNA_START=105 /DNA_END=341 /DNA_ORIENTATION=-
MAAAVVRFQSPLGAAPKPRNAPPERPAMRHQPTLPGRGERPGELRAGVLVQRRLEPPLGWGGCGPWCAMPLVQLCQKG